MEIINEQGQILELTENTSIAVERYNSLFNTSDKLLQDLVYPSRTGLTETNRNFIGNGHLVESSNEVYSLSVQLIVSGSTFFSGVFVYRIINDEISFEIRVNLGAISFKLKEVSIKDIYTTDSYYSTAGTIAFAALMKDTCQNPLNYPYVFFPVYNDRWIHGDIPEDKRFVNLWNHATQSFNVTSSARIDTIQVPYWRLSYIIRKILEFLKFEVTGNYFTVQNEQEIYMFNLRSLYHSGILPSTSHLPDLKISEFFKQVIERRRISFDIDIFSNTINVVTAQAVLNDPDYIDISDYVESIQEISAPEKKGYRISLKVNDQDEAWNTGTVEEKIFKYPYVLKVGSEENVIEMTAGTLRKKIDVAYSYPMNFQAVNYLDHKVTPEGPVTLLRYNGMKSVAGGKVFPQADPLDLSLSDGEWFQFLNDSKKVIIIANIPPTILSKMKPTTKLGCISNEGTFFKVLPEKIGYNISPGTTELISGVRIEARAIFTDYKTKISIEELETEQVITEKYITKYKAYWNTEIHGIQKVRMERVPLPGSAATFGFTALKYPTDESGIGGSIGVTFAITGNRRDIENSELRVYSEIPPRYFIRLGVKGNFVAMPGYYKFPDISGTGIPVAEGDKPIWIVF